MEIALHLRNPEPLEHSDKYPEHWRTLREWSFPSETSCPPFERIYIGDEFCPNRLPQLIKLKHFCRVAREKRLGMTLLTPVLTDGQLEKYSPLFEYLEQNRPETEVVVNDLGVLFFLKKKHPLLRLAAGRLLNKGFKDPRLKEPDEMASLSQEAREVLDDCTFDHAEFQELMLTLSVARLERDLPPYSDNALNITAGLKTSVYFPFGYVTTGRVCLTAALRQASKERFIPVDNCSRPCDDVAFNLEHRSFSFQIIQNGNTVFYRYPSSMMTFLIKTAEANNIRLVYQGFVIGS